MRKNEYVPLAVIFVVMAVGLGLLSKFCFIDFAQGLQILITFILVCITVIYVMRTLDIANATKKQAEEIKKQTNASLKMAEEMKEQRYDMIRPVIDIKRDTARADINRRGIEAYAASSGETSHGLSGILCNIGPGPAIDVRSFIQHPERERLPWQFGTIESGGKTERMILSISHEDNRMALVAYYEDIYGRTFESSREVSAGKKGEGWEIGPLKIIPQVKERKKL